MKKHLDKLILIFLTAILLALPVKAQAPETLYLQQDRGNTCTLCASTMLLRSSLYLAGTDHWEQVTESAVRRCAWTGMGLSWNWTYESGLHSLTVRHKSTGGMTLKQARQLLLDHPEGIVLYCGGSSPHAVFLTDCTGDTLYCADPADGFSGRRIPLADSQLGRRGSQKKILAAVTAYWYVSDSTIVPDRQVFPPASPGTAFELTPARH